MTVFAFAEPFCISALPAYFFLTSCHIASWRILVGRLLCAAGVRRAHLAKCLLEAHAIPIVGIFSNESSEIF